MDICHSSHSCDTSIWTIVTGCESTDNIDSIDSINCIVLSEIIVQQKSVKCKLKV